MYYTAFLTLTIVVLFENLIRSCRCHCRVEIPSIESGMISAQDYMDRQESLPSKGTLTKFRMRIDPNDHRCRLSIRSTVIEELLFMCLK